MTAGCDEYDPEALTVEQAINTIDASARPVAGHERLMLRECLDRVLIDAVRAPFDVPSFMNSAMDGYALRSADLSGSGETRLFIAGESFAGRPYRGTLRQGECVRIMTGAVLPEGADTVVMQEQVQREARTVVVQPGHQRGHNVRHAGDDLRSGDMILSAGRRLNAADLGLMASLGIAEASVRRRPIVAFFSTGDELKGIGQALDAGEIYDSNRYTLYGLLRRCHVAIRDLGVIPDKPDAVTHALQTAAEIGDLIITSGGVSVGEADYIKRALEENGTLHFGKVAVKPGRPLTFGTVGKALFFGLPGNPVSVMATFILFVRGALRQLSGETPRPLLTLTARCRSTLKKAPGRTEYQRGILSVIGAGELTVSTTGLQDSHVLSSMSKANCFIVLPRDSGEVETGNRVEVIPLEGLL